MRLMSKRDANDDAALAGFGRYAGPATLVLSSLADGPKHGYALTKDVEEFAGVRLAPGTLYEALARLGAPGGIRGLEADDRGAGRAAAALVSARLARALRRGVHRAADLRHH